MNEAQSSLAMALLRKNVADIKAALSAGADPNWVDGDGNTPLMLAIVRHDENAAACLIDGGAEINPSNSDLNPVDFARAVKNRKMAAWLESRGACAATPETTSAEKDLYLAARTGKTAVLEKALAAGVNLDRVFEGGTALCHALYRGHEDMVRALLNAGASPEVTDRDGTNLALRALDDAQDQAHYERMRSLLAEFSPHVLDGERQATFPAYDIDAILDQNTSQDPVSQLRSILGLHEGPLRDHEIMFLAAQEAGVNIPWDGLHGWFHNLSDGSALRWAVRGLEAIGCSRAAAIIQKAMMVFPDGLAPEESQAFESCVSKLSTDQINLLNGLDSEFIEAADDLEGLSVQWLRTNQELFRQARQ